MTAVFRITDGETRTAATNLLLYPSVETGITGYAAQGNNTIARSTAQSKYGSYSIHATYQDDLALLRTLTHTLTAEQYVASAWVYILSNWTGGSVGLRRSNFVGASADRNVDTSVTEAWTRIYQLFTPLLGDVSGQIQLTLSGAPLAGQYIFVDGFNLIRANALTSYIDGDQQFCTWSGTPHASESSRSAFTGTSVQFVGDNRRDGLYLKEIRPQAAPYKDGGTYVSSPLADGRRLVDAKYENVIETLELVARNADQDSYAATMRKVRFLLKKAADYWTTGWATEPVWIEAKGLNETNMRYALAMNGAVPEDDNPWGMPFINPAGIISDEISLVIERLHWMSNPPQVGTPTLISAVESYPVCCIAKPEQSADDANFQSPATATLNGTSLFVGDAVTLDELGIRFNSIEVPKDATIVSAFIRFVATETLSSTTVSAIISGENSSSPATFSTYADFSGRAATTSTVAWNSLPTWTLASSYDTPDISTIIQEIVSRSDWTYYLSDIAIFIIDSVADSAWRKAASWDNVTYDEPILYICYTVP